MNQVRIRQISQSDIEGFHSCLDRVARERKYLGLTQAPPVEETHRWLVADMKRDVIRLIAIDSSQIVGWCDIESGRWEGFTHSGRLGMGVLKQYRGQGIGRSLLDKALLEARNRDLERVELDVYASNLAAIRLYETFKFRIEGRKVRGRKLDGRYDDIILMALLFDS